jgi:hypothetical protein
VAGGFCGLVVGVPVIPVRYKLNLYVYYRVLHPVARNIKL